ncbi:MAG: prepilin-type N-terminal cleavage/methylation domain-containing protein [Desulfobulbus sp.]|nr:prepilin-type N-terminal cleavage/methylation domain-containing protein [Desulfobulbus sp.]
MTTTDRGFTLLEVLLAMTVLGVVVAMLSLSLSGSMRVYEGTEQDEEMYSMAQTAMQRITDDLAAAFVSKDNSFVGENVLEGGHRADRLQFCSLAHLVFNPEKQKPGLALIGYRLEKEEGDERKFRLLRSDQLLLLGKEDEQKAQRPPAFILADNLRSLQLTYFDHQGQEFDSWQGAAEEQSPEKPTVEKPTAEKPTEKAKGGKLPAAVHCILEFWVDLDQETTQIFSTRVILPVGASSDQ